MKQNGTAISTNGNQTNLAKPMVWKEEANTGLDTIRKIILGKHLNEMEAKLQKMSNKYEILLQQMDTRLEQKEAEHHQRLLKLEAEFLTRLNHIQSTIKEEISSVELKINHQSEKTVDFGKVLMELGKEWSLGKDKE